MSLKNRENLSLEYWQHSSRSGNTGMVNGLRLDPAEDSPTPSLAKEVVSTGMMAT